MSDGWLGGVGGGGGHGGGIYSLSHQLCRVLLAQCFVPTDAGAPLEPVPAAATVPRKSVAYKKTRTQTDPFLRRPPRIQLDSVLIVLVVAFARHVMHVQKQSLETVWAETTRWSPLAPTPAPSFFREVLFYTVFLSLQVQRTAMLSMSYHGHSMLFSLSSMTNKYIIHGRNLKSLLNRNKQTNKQTNNNRVGSASNELPGKLLPP